MSRAVPDHRASPTSTVTLTTADGVHLAAEQRVPAPAIATWLVVAEHDQFAPPDRVRHRAASIDSVVAGWAG